jgi:hypothetical protein
MTESSTLRPQFTYWLRRSRWEQQPSLHPTIHHNIHPTHMSAQHRTRNHCDLPRDVFGPSDFLQWRSRNRSLNKRSVFQSLRSHRRSDPAGIDRVNTTFRRYADDFVLKLLGDKISRSAKCLSHYLCWDLLSLTVGVKPYMSADLVAA